MDITKLQKGADEILVRLINAMKGCSGEVHPQSLLCALGSLAGRSCQQDIRDIYIKQKHLPEDKVFNVVHDKQGGRYLFGELQNELLVNERFSVYNLTCAAVTRLGGRLPDIDDIFRYVSYTAGGGQFGKVRSCETGDTMEGYLEKLWQPMKALAQKYADEGQLHALFGIALQKAVYTCGKSIDVTEAARIALESAVSMAFRGKR